MKNLSATLAAFAVMAGIASADEKLPLTLQLKWIPQAQFAGYYVAKDKGFYDEEDIDVTIKPGGPDIVPAQVLAGGGADVIVEWMPAALVAREKGLPIVNIAQPFKKSGQMLTCLKESGVNDPKTDLGGKTLGTWFGGNEYPFMSWMSQLGLATDGSAGGVTVVKQGFNVEPLLQKQAACISTMSYNEYGQLLDAGITPDQLVSFSYEDQGVATLEDGLYILESTLQEKPKVTALVRFVRASMKGWEYAAQHPDEAAEIVLKHDETGGQTIEQQTRMATEVLKLVEGSTGKLDPADYQRTVDRLSGGAHPVLTKAPVDASVSIITDRAFD